MFTGYCWFAIDFRSIRTILGWGFDHNYELGLASTSRRHLQHLYWCQQVRQWDGPENDFIGTQVSASASR